MSERATGKKRHRGRPAPARFQTIGDLFYRTRVLLGRQYTLRLFAEEQLGGTVDPVMLGYIEKGKRLPSEALVRRLAAVRGEDPRPLLAILWRDRMVRALARELRRALDAPAEVGGVSDAELAVLVSQAIAALPDDGSWLARRSWRRRVAGGTGRRPAGAATVTAERWRAVEQILQKHGLIEVEGDRVRRRGRHYVPTSGEERWALAMELSALFAKGLLDKVATEPPAAETYLRNHYLHISPERIPELQRRLEEVLRSLAEEFAEDPSPQTRFFNMLVVATPLE